MRASRISPRCHRRTTTRRCASIRCRLARARQQRCGSPPTVRAPLAADGLARDSGRSGRAGGAAVAGQFPCRSLSRGGQPNHDTGERFSAIVFTRRRPAAPGLRPAERSDGDQRGRPYSDRSMRPGDRSPCGAAQPGLSAMRWGRERPPAVHPVDRLPGWHVWGDDVSSVCSWGQCGIPLSHRHGLSGEQLWQHIVHGGHELSNGDRVRAEPVRFPEKHATQ